MKNVTLFLGLVVLFALVAAEDKFVDEMEQEKEQETEPKIDEKELEYKKGSACGYCTYCKFCDLCEADCPCETSPTKPNCHMCKYCKFCYLCSGVCDTICQPGGIIDKVSSAIVNSLPSLNEEEVEKDLDSVKSWIDKEEL